MKRDGKIVGREKGRWKKSTMDCFRKKEREEKELKRKLSVRRNKELNCRWWIEEKKR